MPSSSGMNPIADRATFCRRSSTSALTGDAGAAVEGGLVLEDLGVMLEHQLVEDDELDHPEHAEGGDVGELEDEAARRLVQAVDVRLHDAHGDRRDQPPEEGEGPEGDDLLEQVRPS